MIGERARTIIIGVVTTVWAVNFFAGLIIPHYKPDQAINGIFLATVGTIFILKNKDDKSDSPVVPKPPVEPPVVTFPEGEKDINDDA